MRHPVSTPRVLRRHESGAVVGDVAGKSVLPAAPQHADPGAREDARGMGVIAAALPGARVNPRGPYRRMAGVVGEGRDRLAQAFVAGPAEADAAGFAGGARDGRDPSLGGEVIGG